MHVDRAAPGDIGLEGGLAFNEQEKQRKDQPRPASEQLNETLVQRIDKQKCAVKVDGDWRARPVRVSFDYGSIHRFG